VKITRRFPTVIAVKTSWDDARVALDDVDNEFF